MWHIQESYETIRFEAHPSMSDVTWLLRMCHTYNRVIWNNQSRGTPINESRITHVTESCHTYAWVMTPRHGGGYTLYVPHMQKSHVTNMNASYHTWSDWSHTCVWTVTGLQVSFAKEPYKLHRMRHITHDQTDRTRDRDMSHTWTSHVTHLNESWQFVMEATLLRMCHTYEGVMSNS